MPDFIKFVLCNLIKANFLLNHPDIKWKKGEKDFETEDIIFRGKYLCMDFEIIFKTKYPDSPKIEISGSFHKLKNNGEHNHNSFSFLELQETVYSFCEKFQIDVNVWTVHTFEIGLNIQLPVIPNRDLFERFIVLNGDGGAVIPATFDSDDRKLFDIGIKFNPSTQYVLKCYGKEKTGLLRIEAKIKKMQKLDCDGLKNLKLTHLVDFINPENLKSLFEVLVLKTFDKIFIDEVIEQSKLKPIKTKHFSLYKEALRFDFWRKLSPNKKRYYKELLHKLQLEHGNYAIKQEIIQLLIDELYKSFSNQAVGMELYNNPKMTNNINGESFEKHKLTSDYHTIEDNLMLNRKYLEIELTQELNKIDFHPTKRLEPYLIPNGYCMQMNFKWLFFKLNEFLYSLIHWPRWDEIDLLNQNSLK